MSDLVHELLHPDPRTKRIAPSEQRARIGAILVSLAEVAGAPSPQILITSTGPMLAMVARDLMRVVPARYDGTGAQLQQAAQLLDSDRLDDAVKVLAELQGDIARWPAAPVAPAIVPAIAEVGRPFGVTDRRAVAAAVAELPSLLESPAEVLATAITSEPFVITVAMKRALYALEGVLGPMAIAATDAELLPAIRLRARRLTEDQMTSTWTRELAADLGVVYPPERPRFDGWHERTEAARAELLGVVMATVAVAHAQRRGLAVWWGVRLAELIAEGVPSNFDLREAAEVVRAARLAGLLVLARTGR